MQFEAGHPPGEPVEDQRRECLGEGVVAQLLPAADHVLSSLQRLQKARNLFWIILQIGIEREHDRSCRHSKSQVERSGLTVVSAHMRNHDPRVRTCDRVQHCSRSVGRTVIDVNNFSGHSERG